MQELSQVYLIASFPDAAHLVDAVRSVGLPRDRMAILGNEASGATNVAKSLGIPTELDSDIPLDEGQRLRLDWHLANHDHPLLAVAVPAEEGRDVRLRLTELGGEPISAPDVASQVGDVDVEPGMVSDKPPLSHADELAFKRE